MNKPEMIIFDYGHTLCYEAKFDSVRGTEAILKHASSNKYNLSVAEISAFSERLFNGDAKKAREFGIEVHNLNSERFMYEYLQISFDLPLTQIEHIFWENASQGKAMPNADKALTFLKSCGIRSGVISNISFSEATLTNKIDSILPENNFEFVIASSEYVYRKPNRMIFELALRKADLQASDVWYCGDSIEFDVTGAYNAGLFPVWYHSKIERYYGDKRLDVPPAFEHLYIRDWLELIDAIDSLM